MVTPERKEIARAAAKAFGGKPQVFEFEYEFTNNKIGILQSPDSPVDGVTSYATVGLSDFPLLKDNQDYGSRLELLGACATTTDQFANIIASAAACIHHRGWFCAPGIIFPDVIKEYYPDISMRHLLFVPPFLWNDSPSTLSIESRAVAWLQAVPISDNELNHAKSHGPKVLEDIFMKEQIDVYNIERSSVL